MKKLLLVLLALPFIGFGQNVNIPDANFKAYLLGNSLINTNGNAQISVIEAAAFPGVIYCQSKISLI
jgi:L-fucose mutarotase/ribose pyranase (RbsD/FucU family)